MSKQSGLGFRFYVAGNNVSNDISALTSIHGGPKAGDFTGIDSLAMERIGLQRDGGIAWTNFFNPTGAHTVFSALPTTDVVTTAAAGTALGAPAACCVGKQATYNAKRSQDGSFTFDSEVLANGFGLEWGVQITPGARTDTTATNGAGVDFTTVSTAFGWQAYAQVLGITGTSVTLTLQDSADNVTFANITGGAFSAASAIGAQRIASPGATDTVRRYVRVASSGTFTNAQFVVVFMRNTVSTVF